LLQGKPFQVYLKQQNLIAYAQISSAYFSLAQRGKNR